MRHTARNKPIITVLLITVSVLFAGSKNFEYEGGGAGGSSSHDIEGVKKELHPALI